MTGFDVAPASTILLTSAKWSIISLPLSLQEVFALSITDLNFAQLAYSRTVISSLAYQNSIPSSVHRQGMDSRLRGNDGGGMTKRRGNEQRIPIELQMDDHVVQYLNLVKGWCRRDE